MVFILFILQAICLVLITPSVESYVLFAANIDDFRSLAHRIIPGKLADQIADMAVKDNINYRLDKNKVLVEADDDGYKINSDYSSDSSDSFYSADSSKDNTRTKNTYKLGKEDIDLDELVKRVKERLDIEYKIAQQAHNAKKVPNVQHLQSVQNKNIVKETTTEKKLQDYYYKDDNMNGEFGKYDEPKPGREGPQSAALTADIPQYEEIYDDKGYVDENTEKIIEYEKESIVNLKNESNKMNQNYNVATTKDEARDYDQRERKFDEYGNVIKKVTVTTEDPTMAPEYYDETDSTTTTVRYIFTETTPKIGEDVKMVDENADEELTYYEDKTQDTIVYDTETESTTVGPVDYANLFKEVDMLKPSNDSYEDYVTPERDNIFDDDPTTVKPKPISGVQRFTAEKEASVYKTRPKALPQPAPILKIPKININRPPSKLDGVVTPQPIIRAKTARMWYKEPNIQHYDESKKKSRENANKKSSKQPLKTAFPTRQRFSMSTPNYFAKMPAVAEKYNFNEPIPEKDQEPEVIKYIANPPAMINKKVKLE